jgi:hypothetical protein
MNQTASPAWRSDAREFGLHIKQGGWRLGLLVARNVQPGTGHGGDPATRDQRRTRDIGGKVSAREFATQAGTHADRVLRYLRAWEAAAADGHVPAAGTLSPGAEVSLDADNLPPWESKNGGYYPSGGTDLVRADADRRAAYDRASAEAGTSASQIARFAASPKAVRGAILASPEVAKAATLALTSPNIPAERKAEVARELLADPEVADAAFNRTDHQEKGTTQTALGNISQAHHRGEQRRQQERIEAMPPAARDTNAKIGQSGAKIDLEDAVTRYRGEARRFAETVAAALPKAGTYGGYTGPLSLAENAVRAREAHQLAGNTLDALDSYVSGSSLDAELSKIMGRSDG